MGRVEKCISGDRLEGEYKFHKEKVTSFHLSRTKSGV
jgi:hypothetical protein